MGITRKISHHRPQAQSHTAYKYQPRLRSGLTPIGFKVAPAKEQKVPLFDIRNQLRMDTTGRQALGGLLLFGAMASLMKGAQAGPSSINYISNCNGQTFEWGKIACNHPGSFGVRDTPHNTQILCDTTNSTTYGVKYVAPQVAPATNNVLTVHSGPAVPFPAVSNCITGFKQPTVYDGLINSPASALDFACIEAKAQCNDPLGRPNRIRLQSNCTAAVASGQVHDWGVVACNVRDSFWVRDDYNGEGLVCDTTNSSRTSWPCNTGTAAGTNGACPTTPFVQVMDGNANALSDDVWHCLPGFDPSSDSQFGLTYTPKTSGLDFACAPAKAACNPVAPSPTPTPSPSPVKSTPSLMSTRGAQSASPSSTPTPSATPLDELPTQNEAPAQEAADEAGAAGISLGATLGVGVPLSAAIIGGVAAYQIKKRKEQQEPSVTLQSVTPAAVEAIEAIAEERAPELAIEMEIDYSVVAGDTSQMDYQPEDLEIRK